MDKNNVPQDEGFLQGKTRDVCYALDENGKYVQVLSVGWEPKNAALELALEEAKEELIKTKILVEKGELSPIKYYMDKNLMDVQTLSQYTGFFKWRIKRHFKPKIFKKLKTSALQKYADTFNISISELTDINNIK
jgi:hypothetical protein